MISLLKTINLFIFEPPINLSSRQTQIYSMKTHHLLINLKPNSIFCLAIKLIQLKLNKLLSQIGKFLKPNYEWKLYKKLL